MIKDHLKNLGKVLAILLLIIIYLDNSYHKAKNEYKVIQCKSKTLLKFL